MPEATATAPAAAPAAPSAPAASPAPSAPSAPASDPRGAPPRGHKWAAPAAAPKAGQAPIPSQPRTPQQVATGETPKAKAQPHQPQPVKPEASAKPETQAQREARIIKHKLANGEEVEIDIAEHLERELTTAKRKVKVNGQEREVTIAEALERFPLAEGAHQRFREAHEAQQKVAQTMESLKRELSVLKDPTKVPGLLRQILGAEKVQQMMERELSSIYEREKMPPEQRQMLEQREAAERDLEGKRAALERERAEFEAKREAENKQRFEAAKTAEVERIKRDFPVLLQNAKLPTTPRMMARLAQAVSEARSLKIPLTEQQIADRLAAEVREEVGHFGQSAAPEDLRQTLGAGADKLREAEVARVMSQPGRGRAVTAKAPQRPPEIKTPDQYRRWLREQDLAAERARRR